MDKLCIFIWNYPHNWILDCFKDDPNIAEHFNAKFRGFYKDHGPDQAMFKLLAAMSDHYREDVYAYVEKLYPDPPAPEISEHDMPKYSEVDMIDIGQIAAIMADTVLAKMAEKNDLGYMSNTSTIAGWARDFFEETRGKTWDDLQDEYPDLDCWDDVVMHWVGDKCDKMIG